MAAREVEFHEEAAAEFKEAFLWYHEHDATVAADFADELIHSVRTIAEAPQRWPLHVAGTRKLLLHRFPFVIVYRDYEAVIQILAVAHAKRRPGYWLNRL